MAMGWIECDVNLSDIKRESRCCIWSLWVMVCMSVCAVKSENVHLFDEYVYVMVPLSDSLSACNT